MSSHVFVLAITFLALGDPADDKTKDIDKLQGTWKIVSMEHRGRDRPSPAGNDKLTMVFEKDKMSFIGPLAAEEGKPKPEFPSFRIVLDESQAPKSMAIELLNGPKKGEKGVGIYKIDGDELWLCLPNAAGDPPPKEFKTTPETNHALLKLKRAQEKK